MSDLFDSYYTGPERRKASKPRRQLKQRRHRIRSESLISDCRVQRARRKEDEEELTELLFLNEPDQPQIRK